MLSRYISQISILISDRVDLFSQGLPTKMCWHFLSPPYMLCALSSLFPLI